MGDLQLTLLAWYAENRRDLPWRRTRDPYRIWVSEVMLQQTRVETVIPYYERFLQRWPTLPDLAAAPEAEVLKAWEGLGYYSRARNLLQAAREVVERHGGQVPDDPAAFRALRGVGAYTAGAVLSIAFGRPLAAVDGNVLRVLARLFLVRADIASPAGKQRLEALAASLVPRQAAGDWTQALMELGALICLPAAPRCDACPVASFCRARAAGAERELPVRGKKKAPRLAHLAVALLRREDGCLLLQRRPSEGLLGGLWEFPAAELEPGEGHEAAALRLLRQRYGVRAAVEGPFMDVRHHFTHLTWELGAYLCRLLPESSCPPEREDLRWSPPGELPAFPLPVAHQKLARALLARRPAQARLEW